MSSKRFYPLVKKDVFHDACGIGFIATRSGKPEKRILSLALQALKNLSHRGANSFDQNSGDGSGLMFDIPQKFFKKYILENQEVKLKKNQKIAVAMVFCHSKNHKYFDDELLINAKNEGLTFLAKRLVPTEKKYLGEISQKEMPNIYQYIFAFKRFTDLEIERKLYFVRKIVEKKFLKKNTSPYICSFSSKTIIYKGLMSSFQLDKFYKDLLDPDFLIRLAIFHERFSTNTFSSWKMAQPFRMIAHNGEFNTIKGSRLWMNARESNLSSPVWKEKIDLLKPIVSSNGSDSESFDNLLEFINRSGRSIFDAMMIMIPDSYNQIEKYYNNNVMSRKMRDYFIYHENFMKPWDGPAALVFTDGNFIGAKMDRNGLRPLRYTLTKCGLVIMGSEAGIVEVDDNNLIANYHMKSEEIFGVDLKSGEILKNKNIKINEATKKPYGNLVKSNVHSIRRETRLKGFDNFLVAPFFQKSYDPTDYDLILEDMEKFIIPMSEKVSEPIGSMGDDTPLAFLSSFNRKFYDFFKQQFAQVTNPPIDSLREKSVMSLLKYLGSENNLLNDVPTHKTAIKISSPILSPDEILELNKHEGWFPNKVINCLLGIDEALDEKIRNINTIAEKYVTKGNKIIFLSDVKIIDRHFAIPMPLIVSALHNHLVEKKLRSKVSIICVSGDAIQDHHFAVLTALGASAVYPIGAYTIIFRQYSKNNYQEKMVNYRHSIEKGLLKIMSKMGISTFTSYHGSMLLHSIGLGEKLSKEYFPSLPSLFGGIEIDYIEGTIKKRQQLGSDKKDNSLKESGLFRYRKFGELHGYRPSKFKEIQYLATKNHKLLKSPKSNKLIYIRDLFEIKKNKYPMDIKLVEDVIPILKRFGSGGVSFGAISEKSHRELARGFALVGARSNTGEGGEVSDRYSISNPDKLTNSHVKQIASGRFGVNSEYLSTAKEIQIKIAQGAKPGEGGQLPGFKVSGIIASTRSSATGITLISPPPHHDIYSIEDIKQLIYDLKDVNPRSNVSVKLVSQPGVGIVATGIVKAGANIILISGADGGTGASPLGSQKHTGFPWEYGLAETHQALHFNGLREYVTLRVDGGIKNAKDIIFAAILGAEEYDFGTSGLVALGCVMARQCHLNTCPVGIATTDEKYEKRFKGKGENVANYLAEVAKSVREDLATIGFTKLHDIIGKTNLLKINTSFKSLIKKRNISLEGLINENTKKGLPLKSHMKLRFSNLRREKSIDEIMIEEMRQEIITQNYAVLNKKIRNTDRAIGARISGELSYLFGHNNFKGNIQLRLNGTAGQSFGAFLSKGIELRLKGLANDYIGKSMSAGLISIRMSKNIQKQKSNNTLIGNVALYGATGGELYVAGSAAERFAVRNSGASAVVEGVGNHGCEYMTQGTVLILGSIGKNFGAGMTGGVIYLYAKNKNLKNYINHDFVEESKILSKDKNIILRFLKNHIFHTGSRIGRKIEKNWEQELYNFKKVTPKSYESMNFDSLYEKQISFRLH